MVLNKQLVLIQSLIQLLKLLTNFMILSSSHHRCSIIEVMGNRCGDLALYSERHVG